MKMSEEEMKNNEMITLARDPAMHLGGDNISTKLILPIHTNNDKFSHPACERIRSKKVKF